MYSSKVVHRDDPESFRAVIERLQHDQPQPSQQTFVDKIKPTLQVLKTHYKHLHGVVTLMVLLTITLSVSEAAKLIRTTAANIVYHRDKINKGKVQWQTHKPKSNIVHNKNNFKFLHEWFDAAVLTTSGERICKAVCCAFYHLATYFVDQFC
jgi:hypothetical protein